MNRRQLDYYFRYAKRLFANLPKRAYLTLRYQGVRETLFRIATFPLRLTPFGAKLGLSARLTDPSGPARAWYRKNWSPVAVVIPTYGPADLVAAAVRSVQKTTVAERVRIIVCDDGSAPEHLTALRAIEGIDLVEGGEQRGFAANCNRGLELVRADEDAILLNSDIIAEPGWLEVLQHAAHRISGPRIGVVGAKLLYPDGTIQFGGTIRNRDAPEWFDHRFRFKPADFPAANVMQPALAVTGACMYITRACLDEVGLLDEAYGMAYEDVDYCLRVWEADRRVVYAPAATLIHFESKTRGMIQGDRELESQKLFWERWGDWLDTRDVRSPKGGLKIIYVTQDCGIGGGHRVIFEHLHGLRDRGHDVELWTLDRNPPDWFDLQVPIRWFDYYNQLTDALAQEDAIKVATWWQTAGSVWEASVKRGIAAYFVQDLETSYYPDEVHHAAVLSWYRPEFQYMTTSSWVLEQLEPLVGDATPISPGVDLEAFTDRGLERHDDAILAVGRTNPLKNFPLTRDAYGALPAPRPKLWLFGIEPKVAAGIDGVEYHVRPSDAEIGTMMGTCTVFLQTSSHEGFCLPILEAMASGTPIVCTDADGNRDFCQDGVNCLMPASEPGAVRDALQRVLTDPELRERLVAGGHVTAAAHAWPERLDAVERWLTGLAGQRAARLQGFRGAAASEEQPAD